MYGDVRPPHLVGPGRPARRDWTSSGWWARRPAGRSRRPAGNASPVHRLGQRARCRSSSPTAEQRRPREPAPDPRSSSPALRRLGKTFEYVTYPTEAHGFLRSRVYDLDFYRAPRAVPRLVPDVNGSDTRCSCCLGTSVPDAEELLAAGVVDDASRTARQVFGRRGWPGLRLDEVLGVTSIAISATGAGATTPPATNVTLTIGLTQDIDSAGIVDTVAAWEPEPPVRHPHRQGGRRLPRTSRASPKSVGSISDDGLTFPTYHLRDGLTVERWSAADRRRRRATRSTAAVTTSGRTTSPRRRTSPPPSWIRRR